MKKTLESSFSLHSRVLIFKSFNLFWSPLKILHGRICGNYFRHISQKPSAIYKVFPRIFVSSDEKISRARLTLNI